MSEDNGRHGTRNDEAIGKIGRGVPRNPITSIGFKSNVEALRLINYKSAVDEHR